MSIVPEAVAEVNGWVIERQGTAVNLITRQARRAFPACKEQMIVSKTIDTIRVNG
jgi:hypothetical protein